MELIKNITTGQFGVRGEVSFGLFRKFISLSLEDNDLTYAKACAASLNSLPDEVLLKLCEASILYCNDCLDNFEQPEKNFEQPKDVLSLIYPNVLIVPCPKSPFVPVIHLELDCEWEEEHGMEWLVRGNEVLYVGAFKGVDPWSDFSDKCWNYACQASLISFNGPTE